MQNQTRPPEKLPDPWLFDSEALLRQLARNRELTNQIPITDPNATHLGIQLAVNAQWNLEETLRYILHLHREQQRSIRHQHDQSLQNALSGNDHNKIVSIIKRARKAGAVLQRMETSESLPRASVTNRATTRNRRGARS